jgi:nucleoside 2-deoxyribosyltransferase
MNIYLAGPIHGRSDAECRDWRLAAKAAIEAAGHSVIDPMNRDYRGCEEEHAEQLVADDKEAIELCDALLVNANAPSWGTAMEIVYGIVWGKQVVAFSNAETISPWLRCHTNAIFHALDQAVAGIVDFSSEGMR